MSTLQDDITLNAGRNLGRFWVELARQIQRSVGFGYQDVPGPEAPNSYEELRDTWDSCSRSGLPYPVSREAGETIYERYPEGNLAFRFVHDFGHAILHCDFGIVGEAAVAEYLGKKVATEFGLTSQEYALYWADTLGQSLLHKITGKFAQNQRVFDQQLLKLMHSTEGFNAQAA